MNEILTKINDFMYTYILLILLVGAGIYFSVSTKGVQIRLLKDGIRSIMDKGKEEEKVSSFQALMISTASRVGTGNIAGIATAVAAGGLYAPRPRNGRNRMAGDPCRKAAAVKCAAVLQFARRQSIICTYNKDAFVREKEKLQWDFLIF